MVRLTLLLALSLLSTGCFQELDSRAADETLAAPVVDPDAPLDTLIEDPEIGLDLYDEEAVTDDPCVKTQQDAHAILEIYCAGCHDQGEASNGVPRFDFLMDDERLLSETWTVGNDVRKFVIPGEPDNSWLYLRPLLGTMPPIATDLRNPDSLRPTISDLSVLREWITSCVGETPVEATSDDARFNFEADVQGWEGLPLEAGEGGVMSVDITTAQKFLGEASLAGSITSTGASKYFMQVANPPDVTRGARITYHVFIPDDAPILSLQPYAIDVEGVVTASYWMYPATGEWTTLTVVIPDNASPIRALGVEFRMDGVWNGTLYIDSVDW